MNRFLIYNFSGEVDEISHLFPNERLARIAAIVRKHGKEAVILDRANFADLNFHDSAFMRNLGGLLFHESNALYEEGLRGEARRIEAGDFDCILMNLWHGTGFKFSVDLAALLKKQRPSLRIIGIGQKVDWFRGAILDLTGNALDGLITGLGYDAIEFLAEGQDIRQAPSAILKDDEGIRAGATGVVDVDRYPPPVYDAEVYREIDEKIPVYSITLSNQACPNRCVFCVRPENYGRQIRKRDLTNVLREIETLRQDKGVTHFRIEDSTPPPRALTKLAGAIAQSALAGQIALTAFSRVDQNRREDFRLMKDAGFLCLFFGIESLDDDNLVRLRKGIDPAAIGDTLSRAHGAGIRTVGSFIFPTPGETTESMNATLARIRELKPVLDSVLVLPAGIYPTTEWGKSPAKFGVRLAEHYIDELIIYPIKYEVPMRHWKPFPFTYRLMGKEADQVSFADIVDLNGQFIRTVKEEIGIPRIPDYYYLLAHLMRREPVEMATDIVTCIMQRDYSRMRALFFGPVEPAERGNSAKKKRGTRGA